MEKHKLRLAMAIVFCVLALTAAFVVSASHSFKNLIAAETEWTEASLENAAVGGKQQLHSFLDRLCAEGESSATLVSLTGEDSELLYRCFDLTAQNSHADAALLFDSEGALKYGAAENSALFAPCAMNSMLSGAPAFSEVLLCGDGIRRFAVSVPCENSNNAVTLLYPASLLEEALSAQSGISLFLLHGDGSPLFPEGAALPWQLSKSGSAASLSDLSGRAALCGGDGIIYVLPADIGSLFVVSSAPMTAVYSSAEKSFLNSCSFIVMAFLLLAVLAIGCIIYLSSRKRMLRLERQRFNFAANQSNRVVFEYRRDRDRLTFISSCAGLSLPAGDTTVTLASFLSLLKPDDHDEADKAIRILHMEGCTQLTVRMSGLRSAGEYRWYHITAEELSPSSATVLGTIEDIDEREREHIDLLRKAKTDSLTGLYNRAEIEHLVNERLFALEEGQTGTFCIVDMDNFKLVNDNNGHDCGDRALLFFAARLSATFRHGDIIGRLGGDEFAVYMERTADRSVVQRRFDELMNSLSVRERAEDAALPELTCSIGCVAAQPGDDFSIVYGLADKALYRAKTSGKRKAEFEETA